MPRRVPLDNAELAIEIIRKDGGVILTNFSSISDVEKVNSDAFPFLSEIKANRASSFLPPETARCTRLFGRSVTAREIWLQQIPLRTIVSHFLRTVTVPYHWKEKPGAGDLGTDPIISAASTLDICPGVKAQDLHRDDFIWQQKHEVERDEYQSGDDVGMGLLVAGIPTRKGNGATLFVPGSHLWADSRPPKLEEAKAAEMKVGEAFLFLASAVHAGGANVTENSRIVHGFFFCRSYLRPEENQHVWWTKTEVQQWSVAAQKQAGYMIDHPFLGYCDETDPIKRFRSSDTSLH